MTKCGQVFFWLPGYSISVKSDNYTISNFAVTDNTVDGIIKTVEVASDDKVGIMM